MAIVKIEANNYYDVINSEKPVLVEFSAPWCVYCRKLKDTLELVAKEYEDVIVTCVVNIDEAPELAEKEKIELIPTLLLYQKGELLGRIINPESKDNLVSFIEERIGQNKNANQVEGHIYDTVVIGGGPGGYTAALYGARAGLDIVVVEKMAAGGQLALTEQIDNYPGFVEGIGGYELSDNMKKGAERFGVESIFSEVISLNLSGDIKEIKTTEGMIYGKSVIIATGANPRELGIENEKEWIGKGLSYCATCDGMFYKDKTVLVIGGGNTAVADAIVLSRICKKVILVHRRDSLRATKIYNDTLNETKNIEFIWDSRVVELKGNERLEGVCIENIKTGQEKKLSCDGVFVAIGRKPATELVAGQLVLDNAGYIKADESTITNIDGVFAVGDVRTKALRQVVTAVSDGAIAIHYIEEYLASKL